MLLQLTVGKVDAGVAVLLTEDKRLVRMVDPPSLLRARTAAPIVPIAASVILTSIQIEFPSILLPPSINSGSIVDITVSQNHQAEQKSEHAFVDLQSRILNAFGLRSPSPPTLRLRNATQTSLVLEWDPIELAATELRSLSLFRNESKAGIIPRPKEMLSTKISGLSVDLEYSFYLVLKTSGGTYTSPVLTCRTHKMTDLSGITVSPGVMPEQIHASVENTVERIGGRMADTVRIDTTHFVCTEGRGKEWERAVEMSIPVVRPEWIDGCEREGRIVGVSGYYLDANPKHRKVGSNPQLTNVASSSNTTPTSNSSTSVPVGEKGSQTKLSERPAPSSATTSTRPNGFNAASPDVEDGGPGPEDPPTPPPKNDKPSPVRTRDAETTISSRAIPLSSSSAKIVQDDASAPDATTPNFSSQSQSQAQSSSQLQPQPEVQTQDEPAQKQQQDRKQKQTTGRLSDSTDEDDTDPSTAASAIAKGGGISDDNSDGEEEEVEEEEEVGEEEEAEKEEEGRGTTTRNGTSKDNGDLQDVSLT
jgi:chitin biosynthesis protein CHS5